MHTNSVLVTTLVDSSSGSLSLGRLLDRPQRLRALLPRLHERTREFEFQR